MWLDILQLAGLLYLYAQVPLWAHASLASRILFVFMLDCLDGQYLLNITFILVGRPIKTVGYGELMPLSTVNMRYKNNKVLKSNFYLPLLCVEQWL